MLNALMSSHRTVNRRNCERRGSVTTVARDIDGKGRIAGYYDTIDGSQARFHCRARSDGESAKFRGCLYGFAIQRLEHALIAPCSPLRPINARYFAELVGRHDGHHD